MKNLNLLKQTAELISQSGMSIEELVENSKILESFLNKSNDETKHDFGKIIYNKDFNEFCKSVKIMHCIHGSINLYDKDFYEPLYNLLVHHNSVSVINDRQIGITTFWALYSIFYSLTHGNSTTMYMNKSLNTTDHFVNCVQNILSSIEGEIDFTMKDRYTFKFGNGSSIMVKSSNSNFIRGMSLSNLIIDDADYVQYKVLTDIINCAAPAVGKFLISSNYSGKMDSVFYDYYTNCPTKIQIKR